MSSCRKLPCYPHPHTCTYREHPSDSKKSPAKTSKFIQTPGIWNLNLNYPGNYPTNSSRNTIQKNIQKQRHVQLDEARPIVWILFVHGDERRGRNTQKSFCGALAVEVDLKLRCEWMVCSKLHTFTDSMSQTYYLSFARLQTNMPSSSGCKAEKSCDHDFSEGALVSNGDKVIDPNCLRGSTVWWQQTIGVHHQSCSASQTKTQITMKLT